MPARNVLKPHIENSWYHLYNRGINRQQIFLEDRDYLYLINLLKTYLSPDLLINPNTGLSNEKNISNMISLSCFCLMPNHFHFLVKQTETNGITKLTQRVFTAYFSYMNLKYNKTGPLFDGKLKGVLVDSEEYLLHLSRYIHRNPLQLIQNAPLSTYPYSSYSYYIGHRHASWVQAKTLLDIFYLPTTQSQQTYKEFVEFENEESDNKINDIGLE
jgi:putative transposase